MPQPPASAPVVAVVGGGPAGLMAAEVISAAGVAVDLYEAMGTPGRKFLLAGRSGLNITQQLTEQAPLAAFLGRYGSAEAVLAPWLTAFTPEHIRAWVEGFGISTFVGGGGRVFPAERKAAPLLRAWRQRLEAQGVRIHTRHRWQGWDAQGGLRLATDAGERRVTASALVLALGGGSWPRMGSDGAWVEPLRGRGVRVAALQPSNCGFDCPWSDFFRQRYAWQPLKSIRLAHPASGAPATRAELMISAHGIEGGAVYALTPRLRDEIAAVGHATLLLDLTPDRSEAQLAAALGQPRGKASLAKHLKRRAGLEGLKVALLHELSSAEQRADPHQLARCIKGLPLRLSGPRPLAEAISSAGGVGLEQLDEGLMLRAHPGLFVAGEMLDWEAPTGGYLLSGCLATGRAAGQGVLRWLAATPA